MGLAAKENPKSERSPTGRLPWKWRLELGHEMDLPGDLDEAEGRVEAVADGVLGEGFDFGVGQAGGAEVAQGVLDEQAAEAAVAVDGAMARFGIWPMPAAASCQVVM